MRGVGGIPEGCVPQLADELHVVGGWRPLFSGGWGLGEMKAKADRDGEPVTYTVTAPDGVR
ncbi:hypothetical protein [Streptomyces rimosus]|uniref:hypothetical protein n=1 Tax=Streptomyces rimosus TaxID=1927 RepID=UPI00378CDFD3